MSCIGIDNFNGWHTEVCDITAVAAVLTVIFPATNAKDLPPFITQEELHQIAKRQLNDM